MRKYRVHRSPSKHRKDPYADAVTTARRLYMLDGYKKSEVAQHLASMYVSLATTYIRMWQVNNSFCSTALNRVRFLVRLSEFVMKL